MTPNPKGFTEYFRPCIDLHEGRVKQIVGSTLASENLSDRFDRLQGLQGLQENYVASEGIEYFTDRYAHYGLTGGHIIMLDKKEETLRTASKAVEKHPGLYQVGGGMHLENGGRWLSLGAEKIIVSSYLFPEGRFREEILEKIARAWGRDRLVIDLSSVMVGGEYRAAIHGWKTITDFILTPENLGRVADYCDEILIHAIDQEGKQSGIDGKLFSFLESSCPVAFVYAGGIHSLDEVAMICERSQQSGGRIGFTIGSSLDLFGGNIPLEKVLEVTRRYRYR